MVSGAIVGAGLLFASAVDLRDILVRLSPPLIDFVAFGQEAAVGAAINVAFAAVCGLIGASLQLAPHRVRRFVVAGALGVLVLSMLEPFLRPRLTEFDLGFISVFLFQQRGLSIPAAILTFARRRCRERSCGGRRAVRSRCACARQSREPSRSCGGSPFSC